MSFIIDIVYVVSWGNYYNQTCFSPLDAVINEFLTTAPVHVDKHIMTRKKGDYVCCLYCLCYECRVFEYRPLSKPGLFLWKKTLKHSKEYFVSGCLKQDRVPENGRFSYLFLEKKKSFQLQSASPPDPHRGPQKAPWTEPHFQAF